MADGLLVKISSGTIITGDGVNIISLTELKKDAFNYTTKEIAVAPGDYKIRMRRINDATSEYDGWVIPVPGIMRSYSKIPNNNYLGFTANVIVVGLGRDTYLKCVDTPSINKNEWKLVSVIAPPGVTLGSHYINPNEGNRELIFNDIQSISPGFTSGNIVYNIQAMNGSGNTYDFSLIQKVEKSATQPDLYTINADNLVYLPAHGGNWIKFFKATQDLQATGNRRDLSSADNCYYTIYNEAETEPTPIKFNNFILFEPASYTSTSFVVDQLYTYIIKLYSDINKTETLCEAKVTYRHRQGDVTPYRIMSKGILYAVTGYTNQDNFVAPKYLSDGTLHDIPVLRTAVRLQSSAKVNGQVDGINGVVQSVGYNWYPTNSSNILVGEWRREVINNPASLFLYVLMHPANAYRIDAPNLTALEQLVDLDTIKEWHYYCNQNNFTFNTVIDNISSVMDVLRDICAAGRASPLLKDGKWSVVVDKERDTIAQHFTPHNSWGFEGVRAIPRTPDAFRCVIRDEENGYQDREIVVYNTGKNSTNSTIYEQISLPGITNEAAAVKHIRWNLAQVNHRPERYTLNTDLEYLVCNRGDRVKVAHDVPLWGTASGRFGTVTIAGSQRQVTLDDVVLLETGTNYIIRVRLSNGAFELGTLTVPETKYYTNLTYTVSQSAPSGSPAPDEGDLFLIGKTDTAINDLIVLSIEPLDNKNARLVLVDYSPGIFTENQSALYSNISSPVSPVLPEELTHSITETPINTTIYDGEIDLSSTTKSRAIFINVFNSPDLTNNIVGVEVQLVDSSSSFEVGAVNTYRFLLTDRIILSDIQVGKTYKIRIRYYGNDNRVGPWKLYDTLSYTTYTVPLLQAYADFPENLSVDLDRFNILLSINRTTQPPEDFSHYEVRVLKDMDSVINYDFWDAADDPNHALYPDIIKVTSTSNQVVINLLNFSKPRIDPTGVMYRIACKSVSKNNNKSRFSNTISYLVTPLI